MGMGQGIKHLILVKILFCLKNISPGVLQLKLKLGSSKGVFLGQNQLSANAIRNKTKFTGKNLCWSLFSITCKPPACNISKKRF